MKNFRLIGKIDVSEIQKEISDHPELWDQNTLRTAHPGSAHKDVSDIWIYYPDIERHKANLAGVINDLAVVGYDAAFDLRKTVRAIDDLSDKVDARIIGKTVIAKLKAGGHIDAHEDSGKSAQYFDRYHIVIESDDGNTFRCGDETIHMKPGEIWWFDNLVEHELFNNSQSDRIHIVTDMRA